MNATEPRTSGTLIRRVKRIDDQAAWTELFDRYQPMLVRWTKAQLGNRIDADEVSQRIWAELVTRLPEFSYDSKRSFRAWLKCLHRSRLLDYIKHQRRYRNHLCQLADEASEPIIPDPRHRQLTTGGLASSNRVCKTSIEDPTSVSIERLLEIQQRVEARVSKKTWELYYQVTIENHAIGDVARQHSMRYASVFAAVSRVNKMLKQEAVG